MKRCHPTAVKLYWHCYWASVWPAHEDKCLDWTTKRPDSWLSLFERPSYAPATVSVKFFLKHVTSSNFLTEPWIGLSRILHQIEVNLNWRAASASVSCKGLYGAI